MDAFSFVIIAGRSLMGWILITAGIEKAVWPTALGTVLSERLTLSGVAARRMARWVGTVEAGIGAAFLLPGNAWIFASLAAVPIFASFSGILAAWRYRAATRDCGCGGILPFKDSSLAHIIVNVALAASSGILAVIGLSSRGSSGPYSVFIVGAAAMLLVILSAAVGRELLAIRRGQRSMDEAMFGDVA